MKLFGKKVISCVMTVSTVSELPKILSNDFTESSVKWWITPKSNTVFIECFSIMPIRLLCDFLSKDSDSKSLSRKHEGMFFSERFVLRFVDSFR